MYMFYFVGHNYVSWFTDNFLMFLNMVHVTFISKIQNGRPSLTEKDLLMTAVLLQFDVKMTDIFLDQNIFKHLYQ